MSKSPTILPISAVSSSLRKILIVDDQFYWLNTLKESFRKFPLQVYLTQTAEEALKLCKEYQFEWIICDLKLENIQGIDLIQKLKPFQRNSLFLLLTGYGSVANTVYALKKEFIMLLKNQCKLMS